MTKTSKKKVKTKKNIGSSIPELFLFSVHVKLRTTIPEIKPHQEM